MGITYNRQKPEIDANIFQAITCAMDMFQIEGPLLPNIHEIHCDDTEGHALWNIYPFLSSKLLHFGLQVKQPPDLATMTILSTLKAKSPHIQRFWVVGGWFYKEELAPQVSSSLCGLLYLVPSNVPKSLSPVRPFSTLPSSLTCVRWISMLQVIK